MDGGVDQGPWLQERVGGGVGTMAVPNRSKSRKGSGKGWLGGRGGCKGFGCGGVGGRGTGLRDGQKRKMAFFEGCPVGWGGCPPELAWWTGG